MNAPMIWIIAPAIIALLLFGIRSPRLLSMVGGAIAVLLSVTAQFVPIEEVLTFGAFSFKINSTLEILGRVLEIKPAEGSLLAIIYGATALWFFGAEASGAARQIVPHGLLITTLMVASLAVEPFLFAALFIEMAILLAVPMLVGPEQTPGRGVVRFLIYQTLAMPFILLSGWLLSGVEASPGDISLATQSASMLGLGFAFLLAIFPLYNWIPMLTEEAQPFTVGFVLWIMPVITILFGAGFLDRYSWLRSSPNTALALQYTGLLMVVTGGLWTATQHHLGRIMAYASIAETGFAILALSMNSLFGIPILFLLLPARALGLAVWSLALTVIRDSINSMRFSAARGVLRNLPFASVALVAASLSMAAFPLLAGFPARLALWENLSRLSLGASLWMGIGIVGLLTGSLRSLAVLSMADEYTPWEVRENWLQGIMLGLGIIGLFILGFFPQLVQFFLSNLPAMFERLGH
jgi:formate hydrogenlyase subunit 3/multisubunit Na+/H+ antiporter MnhD subunit